MHSNIFAFVACCYNIIISSINFYFNKRVVSLPKLDKDIKFIFQDMDDLSRYQKLENEYGLNVSCKSKTIKSENETIVIFVLNYKNKYFVLCCKEVELYKNKILYEVLSFSGIGKKMFLSPLDIDALDDIRISKGEVNAYVKHIHQDTIKFEIKIEFVKRLEYVNFTEVSKMSCISFEMCKINTILLRDKTKPIKNIH